MTLRILPLSPELEAQAAELEAQFGRLVRIALAEGGYGVLLAQVWFHAHQLRGEPEIAFHPRRPQDRIRQNGR